jgi:class 3 adenylate cyclase
MKLRNEKNESKRSERLRRLEALFLEANSGEDYSGEDYSGEDYSGEDYSGEDYSGKEPRRERGYLFLEAARLALRLDPATSRKYALEALSRARASSNDELEMESGVVLANVAAQAGDFDEALPRLFQIARRAESLSSLAVRASALRSLADSYARISLFTSALDYASQAQRLAEEIGDDSERALAWKISGDAYIGLGEPRKALQYYREALRIAEERDKTAAGSAEKAQMANTESDVAFRAEERGDILLSMGAAYARLEGFSEARLYYERAFAAYREAGEERGLTKALLGVGDILLAQSRYEQTLELLFAALDYTAGQTSVEAERAQTYCALAKTYLRAERPRKALEYALEAESAMRAVKTPALRAPLERLLSEAYKATGDIEQAYAHLERFQRLQEEAMTHDNKQVIERLQQGFEAEKAQREAEIYRLRTVELAHAHEEMERLLLNTLPQPIAQRLRAGEETIADAFEEVTVVFVDIVGFTRIAQERSAEEIVRILDDIFSRFDAITDTYNLEKIKTIGDAYMIASGIPYPRRDHAESAALAALAMLEAIEQVSTELRGRGLLSSSLTARVGMHTGSVVAGVIGRKKFAYDLWGDTVNTASRMESHGEPGKIHITADVFHALERERERREIGFAAGAFGDAASLHPSLSARVFHYAERGMIDVKGKGQMKTYFLLGATSLHSTS